MNDLRDDQLDGGVGREKALPNIQYKRGFQDACCLRCGEEGGVYVRLGEVTRFACSECDSEWTAQDVRAAVEAWSRVLVWVASAPVIN